MFLEHDGQKKGNLLLLPRPPPSPLHRGFAQWTNFIPINRVLLVEVSDSALEGHIDQVRYRWDAVNGHYAGGDTHSWQRYTRKIPLAVRLSHIQDTGSVSLHPLKPLQADQEYAVVLRHFVPVLSETGTAQSRVTNVAEDKVLFFRTASAESRHVPSPSPAPPMGVSSVQTDIDTTTIRQVGPV